MFDFNVVPGSQIKLILGENPKHSIECVKAAYLAHHDGETVNPDSYFLKFPMSDRNRIIALPASIHAGINVSGIKWIASFPDNIKNGVPRASAVLVLNDHVTGYPFACLEASLISASRTAASAVLGAYWLNGQQRHAKSIAFVGAGVIARNIFDMFVGDGWHFERVSVHDFDSLSAQAFAAHISKNDDRSVNVEDGFAGALDADMVVFATNAGAPYVVPPQTFFPGQVILNISLRDIAPELIVNAFNIFDDIDHCMKANTSPHLAESYIGDRRFVTGTLAALIRNEVKVDRSRPLIFSPFGMGILDLALGKYVFDKACARGASISIPDFFGETERW